MVENDGWWRRGVIYQIYPRSFADGSGDGVGDLRGITAHLDHVAALGVDAVWLSPVVRSPMADFGYDVSDYRDIDPLFGTMADFDALLAACHARGLRLILDQVLSHSSDQHPWFLASRADRSNPHADWYVWADAKDDGGPPNNWLSVFGGSAWQWEPRRRQYYLHNFLASQPDLNFHNPEVRQAALDILAFWFDRGVDGMRLDVCNFYFHDRSLADNPVQPRWTDVPIPDRPVNPHDWQAHLNCRSQPENLAFLTQLRALADRYPHTTLIGEIGDDDAAARTVEYTAGTDRLHMAYSFDLLTARHDALYLHDMLARMHAAGGEAAWPCWPVGNHDCARVTTRWGDNDPVAALLALLLQLTLRGTPCLYMGDELGLPEAMVGYDDLQDPYGRAMWPEYTGRDGCRTPMPWHAAAPHAGFSAANPWLPVDPRHRPLAVDAQQHDGGSMLHATRALLAWRRARPELADAPLALLPAHPRVLGFRRGGLLCLFNPDPEQADMPFDTAGLTAAPPPAVRAGALADGIATLPGWGAIVARAA